MDETSQRLPEIIDWSNAAEFGDVDGDGDLDILVVNCGPPNEGRQNLLLINNGSGIFSNETTTRLPDILDDSFDGDFEDIDNDDDFDIIIGSIATRDYRILINDGSGIFRDESIARLPNESSDTNDVSIGDVDNDGDLDLLFASQTGLTRLLINVVQDIKVEVYVDIKPSSCPNPLNLKSRGVLPIAVLGTEEFDVTTIDPMTILLSRQEIEGGVTPIRWSYEDVATPFEGELCGCHDLNGDGYLDLTLKFKTQELVEQLELNQVAGQTIPLTLTGNLKEEEGSTLITGEDCVWILEKR